MTLENIHVVLVGEIFNDHFEPGIVKKPNLNSTIRIIYKNEVPLLLGSQVKDEKNNLYIGSSLVYKDYIVTINGKKAHELLHTKYNKQEYYVSSEK